MDRKTNDRQRDGATGRKGDREIERWGEGATRRKRYRAKESRGDRQRNAGILE